ncbi:hypothetical protein EDD86DRAFT_206598 [Gorgonomyces haynaldii]|nr:hypothetical protein EDD86DRAFT_206598 [Gorgonomyces haynaldii]
MDRTTDLTDAYVEIRFADFEVVRTQICRKTLDPIWNEDFRFEVSEDSDLQNEPLELKVMDYDQITSNDAIGYVFIDLNPLLTWDAPSQISGWFPIYDSLLGVRGELHAQAKLQFFGDINPFKDSSAGVQFFSNTTIPPNYQIQSVLGFVSSLEKSDDPEYHWADNFRSPRKSNESRTQTMFRLSGNCRRELGKKVLELNGNAILECLQYFDFETDQKTITARSIGTAVRLVPIGSNATQNMVSSSIQSQAPVGSFRESKPLNAQSPERSNIFQTTSPPFGAEQDESDLPPPLQLPNSWRSIDPIFLTMTKFPRNTISSVGGFVCATSIKVFESDVRDIRESWWNELRDEIKSHAFKLRCSHVLGYTEQITIHDGIALLFCSGTAARIDLSQKKDEGSLIGLDERRPSKTLAIDIPGTPRSSLPLSEDQERKSRNLGCNACHITYSRHESPFPMAFNKCKVCGKKYVPEIALFTTEPPPELETIGRSVLIEAHVCRPKKVKVGYARPNDVSDAVPFIHYDLHRQLMYKLRIYSLNCVFGLKIHISFGDGVLTAVATGTAFHCRALAIPPALKVIRNIDILNEEDERMMETQGKLMHISETNRKRIEDELVVVKEKMLTESPMFDDPSDSNSSSSDSDDESGGKRAQKAAMVVQIDDEADEDLVLFLDDHQRDGFFMCTTESLSEIEVAQMTDKQMLTMVTERPIQVDHHPNRQLAAILKSMYQHISFQFLHLKPCVVGKLSYHVKVAKEDTIQVCLNALIQGKPETAIEEIKAPAMTPSASQSSLPLVPFTKTPSALRNPVEGDDVSDDQDELVHELELGEEESERDEQKAISRQESTARKDLMELVRFNSQVSFTGSISDRNHLIDPLTIEIVPTSFVPGSRIVAFLGRLSLHFIKETSLMYESRSGMNGMGRFIFMFQQEIMAVLRAHTIALGGNAVIGYTMDQFLFEETFNQGYGLISISGDIVRVVTDPA